MISAAAIKVLTDSIEDNAKKLRDYFKKRTLRVIVDAKPTLIAGATQEYDIQTLRPDDFAKLDMSRAVVQVWVKDTVVGSLTKDMFINADGVATYGIRANRYFDLINEFTGPLDFYVRVMVPEV